MALPTDSSDPFLREVDENYRREQLENFAKKYGVWIGAAVLLFLAAVGGWLYWQSRQQAEVERQSEELSRIYADVGAGQLQTVPQRLEPLTNSSNDLISASATLTQAAIALERNDRAAAIAAYRALAGNEDMPEAYRNVALVRGTTLEFDKLKPEDVIARMQPLAQAGNPWFGTAGELTALALLRQNKTQEAGRMFAAIAADPLVPPSIRSRATQIAGSLGVDASASATAITQQESN